MEAFCAPEFYRETRKPVEEATTLPPLCYRSQSFYDLEQQRLFGEAWVCVGYTCQVNEPGKMLRVEVAGQPLVITRDRQKQLRAFHNVCRHRGSVLVLEDCKVERFRCPYHSWTYDLSGNLQSCPLFSNNANFKKEDYGLLPVRVEAFGCFVFVCLNAKAPPLASYLGDFATTYGDFGLEELVLVRRKRFEIKANWKLIAENFLEYYHLPWVHPELTNVTAIEMHKRNQGAGMYMSFYASPLLKADSPIDADYLPPMPKLDAEAAQSGYFPAVFPNLAMFLMPHHVFTLLMTPTSPGTSDEFGDLLVHPSVLSEPDAERKIDAIFAFYDLVNVQDIVAVERVQTGLSSKAYSGGRMCYRFEEPVHRFQNMCIDYMTGERNTYVADQRAPAPVSQRDKMADLLSSAEPQA